MIIHKSFTSPAHLLSANVQGPVSFAVSLYPDWYWLLKLQICINKHYFGFISFRRMFGNNLNRFRVYCTSMLLVYIEYEFPTWYVLQRNVCVQWYSERCISHVSISEFPNKWLLIAFSLPIRCQKVTNCIHSVSLYGVHMYESSDIRTQSSPYSKLMNISSGFALAKA